MSDALRAHARAIAGRSHAPYSGAAAGVAALREDGRYVAAPRLENASFPLTIPALQGALALAALAGSTGGGGATGGAASDAAGLAFVAVASSVPLTSGDLAALAQQLGGGWRLAAPDLAVRTGRQSPEAGEHVGFELAEGGPAGDGEIEQARRAARLAFVPASDFPVGAVVTDAAGRRVAGANVEDAADWTRGLCAERTALVAARAAGFGPIARVTVACLRAPGGTPCGGCRQVIAELAPDAQVVIWRGADAPQLTSAAALLPGAFGGQSLGR